MSTTTERELLENAAKAADLWDAKNECIDIPWNSLTNSADALELAVKLDISVMQSHAEQAVTVAYLDHRRHRREIEERYGSDPLAATRLAITRAAAKIQLAKGGV